MEGSNSEYREGSILVYGEGVIERPERGEIWISEGN
jgi:hypothetical protein